MAKFAPQHAEIFARAGSLLKAYGYQQAAGAIYDAIADADENPGDEPEATAWADLDDGSANKPLRTEDLET